MPSPDSAIQAPEDEGILVRIPPGPAGTANTAGNYSSLRPERMSWRRGFLGRPSLEWDAELPVPEFTASFERRLLDWIRSHPTGATDRPTTRGLAGDGRAGADRAARVARLESRFVALTLSALDRWHVESDAVILWDIDETLVGTGTGVRFLRPSSEAVLRYARRHFPGLRHGVLSSLAPAWIPAAVEYIGAVIATDGASTWCEPEYRFSFRPALDRFDDVDWESMRPALRSIGLPDCGGGTFARGWPLYVTEFSRVLCLWHLRRRGINVKVVDNDLNACFDADNSAENQIGTEARAWLARVLGDTVACGPHWWPQEAEEWILEVIEGRRAHGPIR
ncbi:MAG: hypothetical protein JNL97_12580 [Verrucomicrobiales bacterium]|nr:hypothetical protein [Verrucomicrobiales bacterium]